MCVFDKEYILQDTQHTNWRGNYRTDFNPFPHFRHLLFLAVMDRILDFLLTSDTRTELCDGLGLHFGLCTKTWYGLVRPTLD
jgi:hypothetical protein